MGQTLSNGVYLPNEGERNCYAGLASNWQILNTAVGNIAEKAPLVHTHGNITNDGKVGTTANLPLITGTGGAVQAGAFGNQANTFCEGNDGRLSDARTPVAHTHVTSEVLKTGSAKTASPQTNFYFKIASWEMGANQYFGAELLVQNSNYTQNRVNITIGVRTSSSYTLAAGYLYLSNNLGFNLNQFYICYKEESNKVLFELYHYMPSTWNGIKFSVISECLNKSSFEIELFNTMTVYNRISSDAVADLPTGYTAIEAKYLPLSQDINPASNNTRDLGTSTNKWKTLNGVNPGALSLPDYNNYLDVTSSIPVASLDGTQIDLNTYLADKTGWLSIVIADTAGNYITVTQGSAGGSTVFNNSRTFHTGAQSNGYISAFFPIIAGMSKFAFIKASSLIQMRFYYCLGNV